MWGLDPVKGDTSSSDHPLPESSDEEEEDPSTAVLLGYSDLRNFLLESDEFAWLVRQFEINVEQNVMSGHWLQSRSLLVNSLDQSSKNRLGNRHSMTIWLPWQPANFLQQQYAHLQDPPTLGSVITISGEVDDAYATSCEEYISQIWPQCGPTILTSLQRTVTSSERFSEHATSNMTIRVRLTDNSTTLDISGTPLFLAEAAEVLLWVSTACRASETSGMICTGSMLLEEVTSTQHGLALRAKPSLGDICTNIDASTATCWHLMFRNPVIAKGYPIPFRTENEKGLEVSFDAMITLACTYFAVSFTGFVMLKGFKSLLAPTSKVGNSVTWHFLVSGKKRQNYNDGLNHSRLRDLDDAVFDGARHFVGWSKAADLIVGKPPAVQGCY